MDRPVNWRVTDNRHKDSPARMNDGRLFTEYRTSAVITQELSKRLGTSPGTTQFTERLQSSFHPGAERGKAEWAAVTGDPWGLQYRPPSPKHVVTVNPRSGVSMVEQTNGFGVINEGSQIQDETIYRSGLENLQPQSTVPSSCISIKDPMWGISPQTMVFHLRNPQPNGFNSYERV